MRYINELVLDPLDLTWFALGAVAGSLATYAVVGYFKRKTEK